MVTGISIAVTCIAYALYAPVAPPFEMIDHTLFRVTVAAMREGSGYYESMEAAFQLVYGDERGALIENVRAFRMPTAFVLFGLLPSDAVVWYLFVAVAGLSGVVASFLTKRPVLGIGVTAYLLSIGMLNQGGRWSAQFMTTELWAVAPLLGSLVMARARKWWPAALLALVAMLVRETAATVLIAGAVLALVGRVPRTPWLFAFGLGSVAYLLHAGAVSPFIDPQAGEGLLAEPSRPLVILEMMGFGLPGLLVVGPVLWALAVFHVRGRDAGCLLALAPLVLPFAGPLIDREYWGILVVPLSIVWGIDQLLDVVLNRRAALSES